MVFILEGWDQVALTILCLLPSFPLSWFLSTLFGGMILRQISFTTGRRLQSHAKFTREQLPRCEDPDVILLVVYPRILLLAVLARGMMRSLP
jgi:hypothetical protein